MRRSQLLFPLALLLGSWPCPLRWQAAGPPRRSTPTPAGVEAGDAWNVNITVLQHGRTPLAGVTPMRAHPLRRRRRASSAGHADLQAGRLPRRRASSRQAGHWTLRRERRLPQRAVSHIRSRRVEHRPHRRGRAGRRRRRHRRELALGRGRRSLLAVARARAGSPPPRAPAALARTPETAHEDRDRSRGRHWRSRRRSWSSGRSRPAATGTSAAAAARRRTAQATAAGGLGRTGLRLLPHARRRQGARHVRRPTSAPSLKGEAGVVHPRRASSTHARSVAAGYSRAGTMPEDYRHAHLAPADLAVLVAFLPGRAATR